jgi:hypothetical protein
VHSSGVHFPATEADDADYSRAVRQIAGALRLPEAKQVSAMRTALIPALQAKALELRYHAALELAALAHPGHELTDEQRKAIEAVRGAPDLDPALAPLLDRVLHPNIGP